jgi:hypothetical protein
MAPRIKPELLIPDGEPAEPFSWVRTPHWQGKSHLMLRNGVDAPCGAYQPMMPDMWESMAYGYRRIGKAQPAWYRAYEDRKGGHCGPCKTAEKTLDKSPPPPSNMVRDADGRALVPGRWVSKDRREEMVEMQRQQQAAWVARLLGGADVEDWRYADSL